MQFLVRLDLVGSWITQTLTHLTGPPLFVQQVLLFIVTLMDKDLKVKADKAISSAAKLIDHFNTKTKKVSAGQRNSEALKDCFGNKPNVRML